MAAFEPAFKFTMESEDSTLSGKVTTDAGGRTRFGIAQKFHPDLPEEFFTGAAEEALAMAEKIEEQEYWNPLHLAEIQNQAVASKLFDMAVNMGTHQAVIYAQRAFNAWLKQGAEALIAAPDTADNLQASLPSFLLTEDGQIGPKTIVAINSSDPGAYISLLCQFSEAHYRHIGAINPAQAEYLKGWLKRAAKVPPVVVEV